MIRVGSVSQWALLTASTFKDAANVQLHYSAPDGAVLSFGAGDDVVQFGLSGTGVIEFAAVPGLELSVEGLVYYRNDFGHLLESRDVPLLLRFAPEAIGRMLSPEEAAARRRARDARLVGDRAASIIEETGDLSRQVSEMASVIQQLQAQLAKPVANAEGEASA